MDSGSPSKLRCLTPFLAGILVAAGLLTAALVAVHDSTVDLLKPESRVMLPEIALPELDGRTWKLSDQRGNVVVVNFWATTCGPCLAEMPRLAKLAGRFKGEGVRVVGVATDENPLEVVPSVVKRYAIPYPTLTYAGPPPGTADVLSKFPIDVDSVPRTLLLDKSGRLAWDHRGVIDDDVLAANIEDLLREAPKQPQP